MTDATVPQSRSGAPDCGTLSDDPLVVQPVADAESTTSPRHGGAASRERDAHFGTGHLRQELAARSLRGGALTLASQLVKLGLQATSLIVLARLLTPEDFGVFGMVLVITGLVDLFKDLGLSTATIQAPRITHEQVNALFWVNVLVAGALAGVVMAFAPIAAWFYGDARVSLMLVVLAPAVLLGGLAAQHHAQLSRQLRFGALVAIELSAQVSSVALTIGLAVAGFGYWALVGGQLAVAAVLCVGAWFASGWRPTRPSRVEQLPALLRFGGNLTGYNVVNYFARNADNLLIGRFWGAQQLGLYSRAYQLLTLPLSQVNAPLSRVAVPVLSRLVDSPDEYRRAYLRVLEKLALVTAPLAVLLIVCADWLVVVLLGAEWHGAASIFAYLSVAALLQPIAATTGWLFVSAGRTDRMFRWGIIGSTLSILAFVAGLPWGAAGVAASYAISGVVLRTPLLFWYAGREGAVRQRDFYRAATPGLCIAGVTAGPLLLLRALLPDSAPPVMLGVAALVSGLSAIAGALVLPSGRRALRDLAALSRRIRRTSP